LIESKYTKVAFNDVISTMHQGINTAADKVVYVNSGMPIIQSKHFTSGNLTFDETKYLSSIDVTKYGKKYMPQRGDILFSNIGTVGKSTVVDSDLDFMFAWNVFLMKPKSDLLFNSYLQYYLDYLLDRKVYERWFTGGTVKFLNKKTISKLEIPLPPLPEQKKIAEILDAADSLRQKDQQLIDKYTELGQSLFLDMFGDPVTNPKGWKSLKLSEMLEFLTSGSRGWAKYYSDEGALFLRIQNVGKNYLKLDDVAYVKAPESAESNRTSVESGDILLSITADLGRTAVIPDNFTKAHINQHLAILRLKKQYEPFYVSEFLASDGGNRQLMKMNKGGVKAGLNFNDIRSAIIPYPPLKLQEKYRSISKGIEQQKQQAQASLAKSEELFNSLLQRAFKGELTKDMAA